MAFLTSLQAGRIKRLGSKKKKNRLQKKSLPTSLNIEGFIVLVPEIRTIYKRMTTIHHCKLEGFNVLDPRGRTAYKRKHSHILTNWEDYSSWIQEEEEEFTNETIPHILTN